MRNISKMIFDKVAENKFCIQIERSRGRGANESMFLDVETVMQPIIKMKSVFNECDDDYVPDLSFVHER